MRSLDYGFSVALVKIIQSGMNRLVNMLLGENIQLKVAGIGWSI